ncbi:MAG: glycosyltransferase 87 family protein [Thermoplasmata archaeon]|nr:glycosyltransferase 87 family protein [Thermoplasmata archaeon]
MTEYRGKWAPEGLVETLWGDGVRRTRTIIALVYLAVSMLFLLDVYLDNAVTEVMRDRWEDAQTLFGGEFPVTEYPPLSIIFIAIPRLVGWTVWGYEIAWVAMMFVVFLVGLEMVNRIAARLDYSPRRAMWMYAVLMIVMYEFVLDRFDAVAMVLALWSILLFMEKRYRWAFVVLAAATLVKVYPAILFPVFLICLAHGEGIKAALKGFAAFAVTGAAVVAVCCLINPDIITNFLSYNTGRPLQIESVAASPVYFLSRLGFSDWWIQAAGDVGSFGSVNVRGELADAVADAILPLTIAATVLLWLLYLVKVRSGPRMDMRLLALACLASVLVFVTFNKVYSTQYTIWFYAPFMLIVMMSGRRFGDRTFLLMLAIAVLGLINYQYSYKMHDSGFFTDEGMVVLLVRNIVHVALTYVIVREIWRSGTGRDDPAEDIPDLSADARSQ